MAKKHKLSTKLSTCFFFDKVGLGFGVRWRGLGGVHYEDSTPEYVLFSLKCNLDMEMRLTGLENTIDEVKTVTLTLKADFKEEMLATKSTFNMILQPFQSQESHDIFIKIPHFSYTKTLIFHIYNENKIFILMFIYLLYYFLNIFLKSLF